MSLTTRCPACGTTFRVVPDQLKISEGWVRCGACSEVFDATATLSRLADATAVFSPPPAPPTSAASPAPLAESQTFDPQTAEAPGLVGPAGGAELVDHAPLIPATAGALAEPSLVLETRHPPSAPVGDNAALPRHASATDALPSTFSAAEPLPPESSFPEPLSAVPLAGERQSIVDEAQRRASPWHQPEQETPAEEAGFMRLARRRARWQSAPVRALLSVLGFLLASLLAGQYAYAERDRLALLYPEATPLFQRACEWLSCTLGPVRQIESIQIENSGFARVRAETYRLSVSLRNTSDLVLAAPHLELTLTDAQDQTLVRRVLSPAQLGSVQGIISPQSELTAQMGIAVGALPSGARVAGYRLLAFYP